MAANGGANIDRRVRDSFARQSMMTTIGAEVISVDYGRVVLSAEADKRFCQQHGYTHAGLVFSLGDNAAGYAALSTMPDDTEVLTVEMKINLLAPATGRLVAEGRVIRSGRRLVVVAAEVWAEGDSGDRKQIAALQGTMIPV